MNSLYDQGIGENRAIIFENGTPVEYHLERPGVRVGDRAPARLVRREGSRAFVSFGDHEALLDPAPPGVPQGAMLMVEVRREPIIEPGRHRLARVSSLATGTLPVSGPTLLDRLPAPVVQATPYGPDLFEEAGWSEAIEEARTGRIAFPGGALALARTPAFLAVDIDGALAPADLARAAVPALAAMIRRFNIGGSIVLDFPTLMDRSLRSTIGALLDAHLPAPFERTAMNGFGLVQIVRPKFRPSFLDHIQSRPHHTAAFALLLQAERAAGAGVTRLSAHPDVLELIERAPALLAELERRTGRRAQLNPDPSLATSAGHVHVQP